MISLKIKVVAWWIRFVGIILLIWTIYELPPRFFLLSAFLAFLLFLFSKFLLKKKIWAWRVLVLLLSPSLLVVMLSLFVVINCAFYEILAKLPSASTQISCEDFSEFLTHLAIPSLFVFIPFLSLILARKEFFERPIIISEKIQSISSIMSFIIELLFSVILFFGTKVAFQMYSEIKQGYTTLTFLDFGGHPFFWIIVLIFLGVITLAIGVNCLKKKRWAYIGSLIIASFSPTLIPFILLGPPLAPAAAPLSLFVFLGISFISFIWIILLLITIWRMKENKSFSIKI